MANISDPDNTRSIFPTGIDNFASNVDGFGSASADNAEIWNKIETAIYRTERHVQKIVQVVGGPDRKRLRLEQVVTVPATTGFALATFTLTAPQLAFLSQQPWGFGSFLIADAYSKDTDLSFSCDVFPEEPNKVRVRFKRLTPSNTIPAGKYLVKLSIMGL
jgi:hypothetical protein